jgi:hypothetical protein
LDRRTETELILKSRRVVPARLLERGFNELVRELKKEAPSPPTRSPVEGSERRQTRF